MPGGAAAIRQPWRMAAAYLDAAYGGDAPAGAGGRGAQRGALARRADDGAARHQRAAHLERGPAVRRGRGAARACGTRSTTRARRRSSWSSWPTRPSAAPTAAGRSDAARRPVAAGARRRPGPGGGRGPAGRRRAGRSIAARFHNGVARRRSPRSARRCGSGPGWARWRCPAGCSRTCCCSSQVVDRLDGAGFRVLTHARVPRNDGGISFGQAVVAAARDRRSGR